MPNDYQIIDADAHVFEPLHMWQEYLEPEYKSFAPSAEMKIQGEPIYQKVSQEVVAHWSQQIFKAYPLARHKGFTNKLHLATMQEMGIDVSFIYPTLGLAIQSVDALAPSVAGAFTRAYNNWLQDFCSYDPRRLKGIAIVNRHAPEEMVAELHRIAKLGWKAVCLRPNPVKGRLLSDPVYEGFWQECEDLGIAVGIHEGTHSRLPSAGADRFNTRFALRSCSHPMEQMMALLALIEGGVLERYPRLKVGFLESGCGWLPYWLWRLDEEYECHFWEVKETVKMKPSEYFRRQCFVTFEPSEPYLERIIEEIGADNLLFGSDYPHIHWKLDEDEPEVFEVNQWLHQRLPEDAIKKILWENPARFYGLT
ncbi:amidohydrolase family protein [Oscillatoria sp. FACHB-1406]|uniref:amidohydrolase family protein n=1 Tax=Oscillatoria sp. FACHB-1406 TaxID=2692846 RepID=UPI0016890743|nr:amidohydrolase family protein [Oscillatoria sp. FACHB-1406]MBD2578627.1 amidohydrolase [Oscillatoria sp. FACHB-1406]